MLKPTSGSGELSAHARDRLILDIILRFRQTRKSPVFEPAAIKIFLRMPADAPSDGFYTHQDVQPGPVNESELVPCVSSGRCTGGGKLLPSKREAGAGPPAWGRPRRYIQIAQHRPRRKIAAEDRESCDILPGKRIVFDPLGFENQRRDQPVGTLASHLRSTLGSERRQLHVIVCPHPNCSSIRAHGPPSHTPRALVSARGG